MCGSITMYANRPSIKGFPSSRECCWRTHGAQIFQNVCTFPKFCNAYLVRHLAERAWWNLARWGALVRSRSCSTPCLRKKTVQISFWYNFVKFPTILVIFGRKLAKRLKLCEVHSFFTSPNSRHHTKVLKADVPNCYTTLKVVICNKLSKDLKLAHNKLKCGLFSRI